MIIQCSRDERQIMNTTALFETVQYYEDKYSENNLRVNIESQFDWAKRRYEYSASFNWEEER